MFIIYFFIAFIATVLGSLAGLGGGVIIKPCLDTLSSYSLLTINTLSSFTVFSMAAISTFKQIKLGFKVEKKMIFIAIGSILGGILGKYLFSIFILLLENENLAKSIQSLILALLLSILIFKNKFPKHNIQNLYFSFFIGIFLGTIAAFLGIGGGPINVVILTVFMSLSTKEAAINSVFIIFLSQFSNLSMTIIKGSYHQLNLFILSTMVIGGISGGILGTTLNKKLSNNIIEKIFNISIFLIILLNIYNFLSPLL